jgi:hypothetical protein
MSLIINTMSHLQTSVSIQNDAGSFYPQPRGSKKKRDETAAKKGLFTSGAEERVATCVDKTTWYLPYLHTQEKVKSDDCLKCAKIRACITKKMVGRQCK